MNVYLLARWGNGEDPEGPDGQETNMIVRAETLERAAAIADPILLRIPLCAPGGRPVAAFMQHATLIGTTDRIREKEGILTYPWIGEGIPQDCERSWRRDSLEQGWITHEEYHGEPPWFSTDS